MLWQWLREWSEFEVLRCLKLEMRCLSTLVPKHVAGFPTFSACMVSPWGINHQGVMYERIKEVFEYDWTYCRTRVCWWDSWDRATFEWNRYSRTRSEYQRDIRNSIRNQRLRPYSYVTIITSLGSKFLVFEQQELTNWHIFEKAIARLRSYSPPSFPLWNKLPLSRRAAVLVLLFADRRGDLRVVITMRAASLRNYSGE